MKHTQAFLKLTSLARIARAHVVLLAQTERREVGEPDWNRGSVAGYCGIGARYLEQLANNAGLHPVFCAGIFRNYNRILGTYQDKSGHAWLKYQDYIIDITATQFANVVSRIERDFNKPVYVCKATNPHFVEKCVGPLARERAGEWYVESLDELCEKAKRIASESRLKFPS
jgi:hypothetical protein